MKLTGAEYIVKIIEQLDAEYLFAYPGGAVLPIYDALANTKLKCVLVRHEQAASFAAQGYARTMANKPGFCLSTSGPGATNMVTGIADAYADSIPMIAITGQVASNLIGSDAFQEIDITGICLPFTKKTYILKDLSKAEAIFKEAYELTINGRPGPVLIDIPKDVQNEIIELSDDWATKFKQPESTRVYNATPESLDKAINLICKAEKPLIIGGHGIMLSGAVEEYRNFVEHEKIPAISTIFGIGALESENPLYFSWLGMHGMKYANDAVQQADVIIALGIRFDDRITGKLNEFAPNAHIIHVDIDLSEGSKNVPTKVFIHADLKTLLKGFPSMKTKKNEESRKEWYNHLDNLRNQYPQKEADYSKLTMVSALDIVSKNRKDIIVATDVGQHQMWAAQYCKNVKPYSFLTSGGLGSMGFGLPAAMGAQAAQPNKEVWCVTGDGSFQMNLQEMITLVQEGWPVKILLLDNSYLGMVRQWQEQFYERNYSGVDVMNPDYAALADAYGIPCMSVDNVQDFEKAVQEAGKTDGPFLLHARVLKEDNVYPMVPPQTSLSDTLYYPDVEVKANSKTTESIKNESKELLEN